MNEEIKEILDEIRDSYYETQPSTKFYKNVKTIEEHITKLQNKVEELMTLYTTERNVKEDYKSIIKEAREWINNHTSIFTQDEIIIIDWDSLSNPKHLLEILNRSKENV